MKNAIYSISAGFLLSAAGLAQTLDKVNVPLTDPARPAFVKVNLLNGTINVKGYEGKEVTVEAHVRGDHESSARAGGMKRVPMTSTGLSVEEEDNKVNIGTSSYQRTIDVTVQVPYKSSLYLRTVNDGDINVSNVDGELDVNDVNGEVTMTHVSGSAVAHALNGKVLVTFDRVNPGKSMAFSSLNGDIDVTFPADLKATVSLSSDQGDVFSDFDIQVQTQAPKMSDQGRREGGKYVVKVDKAVKGTINGGGQDIQFKNFNGSIYIRRAKTATAQ